MSLAQALTLVRARSCLAALADGALTVETSSAYERVLIVLDGMYGDDVPAIDTEGLPDEPAALTDILTCAIEDLRAHGLGTLAVELLLAMLRLAPGIEVS